MTDAHTDTPASVAVVPYREGMHSIEMAPAAWQLAHRLSDTDFVPGALRGKPGAVMACILYGHELGIDPMQSLQKIHVIDGRPAMAAELMRAIVLRHGHEIWFEAMSTTSVTIIGRRRDQVRETKITWTADDAKRAGLLDKQNWRKYPMDMLAARVTGRLCRLMFADCLAGLSYTLEELSDGEVIDDEDIGAAERDITAGVAVEGAPVQSRHRATKRTKKAAAPAVDASPRPAVERPPLPGEGEPDDDDIVDAEIVDPDEAPDDTESPPESPQAPETPPSGTDAPPRCRFCGADHPDGACNQAAPPPLPPDPEPPLNDDGPRLSGPQMLAMKFAQKGIIDRAIRLTMTSELVGREVTSGNDLTPAEVRVVSDALDDMADDGKVESDPEVAPDVTPSPEVRSGPSEAPPARPQGLSPEGWTGDQWRDFLHRRGVKAGVTLKKARELSGASVPTLDDIAGTGVAEELVGFVEDLTVGGT